MAWPGSALDDAHRVQAGYQDGALEARKERPGREEPLYGSFSLRNPGDGDANMLADIIMKM